LQATHVTSIFAGAKIVLQDNWLVWTNSTEHQSRDNLYTGTSKEIGTHGRTGNQFDDKSPLHSLNQCRMGYSGKTRMLDSQMLGPVVFLLLAAAALVLGGLALVLYVRFERGGEDQRVPVALSAFGIHYALIWANSFVRSYVFVPWLVLFLMTLALILAIWFGSRARSKAGNRIAWAGAFELAAFLWQIGCGMIGWP
jgi:hypothetical protein